MENSPVGLPEKPTFHGRGFDFALDAERLTKSLRRVFEVIYDQNWHTLAEISKAAKCPEPTVSAHLRALRMPENGGFCVERRRAIIQGLWEYRVDFSKPSNLGAPTRHHSRPRIQAQDAGPQVVLSDKVDKLEELATVLYRAAKRYPPSRSGFSGFAVTPLEMVDIDNMAKKLGIKEK